jgi:hypothetical protein
LGRFVELADDDLSEGVGGVECHAIAQELGPLLVLDHAERPHVAAPEARADVHLVPDRPEAQQANAVFASHHLVMALARRQTPLA